MKVVPGTLQWDYKQAYDHTAYMRRWRLLRRGGVPLLSPCGKAWGYIVRGENGFIQLYTTQARRW